MFPPEEVAKLNDLGVGLQIAERMLKCSECVKQGYCSGCGCDMPEAAFDPYLSCSEGKWKPFDPGADYDVAELIETIKNIKN